MIIIDRRIGSSELFPLFSAYDVEVALGELEYGDAAFAGNGPDGDVLVAVERKRLSDIVACMRDKRFSGHQLPGLLENYEYPYLMIEGVYSCGNNGELVHLNSRGWTPFYSGSRSILYSELSGYLNSLELRAFSKAGEPLRVKRTNSPKESVAWLVGLYKNFNDKGWNQHHAHDDIYAPITQDRKGGKIGFTRREVSLAERMYCQIPGLDRIAKYVARRYPWPEDIALMTVEELSKVEVEVDGKEGKKTQRFGKARAEKILPMLRRIKK